MQGPLLLTDKNSTHIVEPGWRCQVLRSGALLLVKEKTSVLSPQVNSVQPDC